MERGLIGPKRPSGRSENPIHLLTLTGIKLQSLGRTARSLAILLCYPGFTEKVYKSKKVKSIFSVRFEPSQEYADSPVSAFLAIRSAVLEMTPFDS